LSRLFDTTALRRIDVAWAKEPLIDADFVSPIRADQRAEGSVDQRFLFPLKDDAAPAKEPLIDADCRLADPR